HAEASRKGSRTSLNAERERAAAQLTNVRHELAKARQKQEVAETEEEGRVNARVLFWGVVVAFVAKANLFEIVTHLDDPWASLGWFQCSKGIWVRAPEVTAVAGGVQATIGCLVTGVCLGFGSTFWHDLLRIVWAMKEKKTQLLPEHPKDEEAEDEELEE